MSVFKITKMLVPESLARYGNIVADIDKMVFAINHQNADQVVSSSIPLSFVLESTRQRRKLFRGFLPHETTGLANLALDKTADADIPETITIQEKGGETVDHMFSLHEDRLKFSFSLYSIMEGWYTKLLRLYKESSLNQLQLSASQDPVVGAQYEKGIVAFLKWRPSPFPVKPAEKGTYYLADDKKVKKLVNQQTSLQIQLLEAAYSVLNVTPYQRGLVKSLI